MRYFLLSLSFLISIQLTTAQQESVFEVDAFDAIEIKNCFTVHLHQGENFEVTASVPAGYSDILQIEVINNTLKIYQSDKNLPTKKYNVWKGKNRSVSVYDKGDCNNLLHEIEIHITFPSIAKLSVSGAAIVNSDNLLELENIAINLSGASKANLALHSSDIVITQSGASKSVIKLSNEIIDLNHEDLLSLDLSGASCITLEGETSNIDLTSSGASNLEASTLDVIDAKIECSGASKINLGDIQSSLNIKASGASLIKYKTIPKTSTININQSGGAQIITY